MDILPVELFGVLVDVPFPTPLGIKSADLDEFGAKICDPEKGLGLRSEQVRLKKWDELFGYELVANFFGDNGTLTRTAERVKLGIRNARTASDWNVIHQTVLRFYSLMEFDPKSVSALSAHLHVGDRPPRPGSRRRQRAHPRKRKPRRPPASGGGC